MIYLYPLYSIICTCSSNKTEVTYTGWYLVGMMRVCQKNRLILRASWQDSRWYSSTGSVSMIPTMVGDSVGKPRCMSTCNIYIYLEYHHMRTIYAYVQPPVMHSRCSDKRTTVIFLLFSCIMLCNWQLIFGKPKQDIHFINYLHCRYQLLQVYTSV